MRKFIKGQFRKMGYDLVPFSQEKRDLFGSSAKQVKDYVVDKATGQVRFNDLGLTMDINRFGFFFKNYRDVRLLTDHCGARFYFNEKGELLCDVAGIKLYIETGQDINTLREILYHSCYNISMPSDYTLIDVGFNVGVTSLFFARDPRCLATYSYEPMDETLAQAMKNLSLNPSLAAKINTYHFGLGAEERVLEIDYVPEMRGSVGINGLPHFASGKEATVKKELRIKNVSKTLNEIIEQGTARGKILLKVDCEGAEYEIFEDLLNTGLLAKVDAVVIEWHVKGPAQLIEFLDKAGFKTYSPSTFEEYIGVLYAFK